MRGRRRHRELATARRVLVLELDMAQRQLDDCLGTGSDEVTGDQSQVAYLLGRRGATQFAINVLNIRLGRDGGDYEP